MPIEWDVDPTLDEKMAANDAALNIPVGTTKKQLTVESGLNPNAYNKDSKAAGLAQVIPSTMAVLEKRLGRPLDAYNPDDAILMHREVMGENLKRFNNLADSLRAYNSGWSPSKWNNKETINYVKQILPETQTDTTVAWDDSPVEWDSAPAEDNVEWDTKDFAKRTVSSTAKLVDLAMGLPAGVASYTAGLLAGLLPKEEDIKSGNVNTFDPKVAKEVKDSLQKALSLDQQLQAAGLATDNPEYVGELVHKVIGEPAQKIADIVTKPETFGNELLRDALMLGIPIGGHKALRAIADKTLTVPQTIKEVLPEAPLKPSESIPAKEAASKVLSQLDKDTKLWGNLLDQNTKQTINRLDEIIQKHKARTTELEKLVGESNEAVQSVLRGEPIQKRIFTNESPVPPVAETITSEIAKIPTSQGPSANVLSGKGGGINLPPNKDLFTGEMIPDDPLILNLRKEIHGTLAQAGKDYFTKHPEEYVPGATVSDNLVAAIKRGAIGDKELAQYGLNKAELIDAFEKSIKQSAQRMAFHSHVSRAMNLTKDQADFLKSQGYMPDESIIIESFLKRADRFRRTMMITQLSTAVGNAVSATGRIGIDVLRSPMDAAIQKTFGLPRTVNPLDGLDTFIGVFKNNPTEVRNILKSFPKEHDRLFSMYYGDVLDSVRPKGQVSVADQISHVATYANRLQEKLIRTGVFQIELEHQLRNKGYDYKKVVRDYNLKQEKFPTFKAYNANPKFLQDFMDSIKASTDRALDATSAIRAEHGSLAYHITETVNKLPFLATSVFPYSNYLFANALRQMIDYNPLGILQMLSKKERAAFMAGDTSTISKAIVGAALFGVAVQIVNSDLGEGKFYEVTTPSGERVDLRPYGPLIVAPLFMASVLKRSEDGTLDSLTSKDVLDGLAGVNFRGGTGLDVMDAFLSGFTNQGETRKKKSVQFAKEFVGSLGSSYFTPFQQLRDIYDQFTEGNQIVRDTKVGSPLIDPTIAKFPMLSQSLPPIQVPSRSGHITTDNPLLKQGLSIRLSNPYNDVEKELIKYGMTAGSLYPKGLDRQLAFEYSKEMGPLVEDIVGDIVRSNMYKNSSPAIQAYMLDTTINAMQNPILEGVLVNKPIDYQIKYFLEREPKRIRGILKELGLMPIN